MNSPYSADDEIAWFLTEAKELLREAQMVEEAVSNVNIAAVDQAACQLYGIQGLFHVDFFFEIAMEKSCFDIHLMYFPVKGCSNVQKNPSIFHACNRGICLSVVDARFLREALHNHMHLVLNDFSIGVPLVVKDRLRRYDFSTSWYLHVRDKIPYFVLM